jgi:hypothetical protein
VVTGHTQADHGTVAVNADGSFTYTPDAGFAGTDTFGYEIADEVGQVDAAIVTITVEPPAAPVAADDTASTPYQTALVVPADGVLGNDTGTSIGVTAHTQPAHGTVTVNGDGSFAYTPDAGFTGTDAFDYTIADEVGQTATATVTIAVGPPAGPVATDDTGATTYGTPYVLDASTLLDNDSGTGITAVVNTAPAHGTVFVNPDGTMTYTPAPGFSGTDSFTYTITDAFGRTASATVTIVVAGPGTSTTIPVDTTTTTSTPSTGSTTTAVPATSADQTAPPGSSSAADLPRTGGPIATLVVNGIALLLLGGVLLEGSRRLAVAGGRRRRRP